jgi:opacity protein-like surface antigen
MTRMLCAALLVLSAFASAARAQEEPPAGGMPAPKESGPPAAAPEGAGPVVPASAIAEEAPTQRIADLSYGVAARLRWISVPGVLLNAFTKQNVPLSSWGTGLELFRRKANFDFILSFNYQNMSPPPGNWLGDGHRAQDDTDYVVFENLSLLGADVSFLWHVNFNEWFGLHLGAGIGIAWVRGNILRISDWTQCTDANAGDINQCHPVGVNPNGSDTLPLPSNLTTPRTDMQDTPQNPHQFVDKNKPPVLPIVNLIVGFNFRLPQVRGWEARIEGGFYDAFFLGTAIGYTF